MADAISFPVYIPPGSTILSLEPLKWREPDGTESTLRRIWWEADGWHVAIDSVSVAADLKISVGSIEAPADTPTGQGEQ